MDDDSTASAGIKASESAAQRELTIVLEPRWSSASYMGARAQIEAEGVVPASIKWPEGFGVAEWDADGLHFVLRRRRPDGAKGPRRDFVSCDNWSLGMTREGLALDDHIIRMKEKEIRRMAYCRTDAYRDAFNKHFAAAMAAEKDEKFQAFKAGIPGLISRGRRTRAQSHEVKA